MEVSNTLLVESGIAIFNVISGQLHKKGRLEILFDAAYWPVMSTPRARSSHMQWEYVGEGFIKELDFGRIWLRLNDADEGDKDDIIAEYKGDAKKFLDQALVCFGFPLCVYRMLANLGDVRMDQRGLR